MIGYAVFACLAMGLVSADTLIKLHTNGRGNGELCGKYHTCNDDAMCGIKEMDGVNHKMCLCKDGKIGNGKLFCKNPLYKSMYIQNDPHILNLNNKYASLPSPCLYRIARLPIVHPEGSQAMVELYGENRLLSNGKYFLGKLVLSTSVTLNGDSMRQTMEFFGDLDTEGKYTFVAKSLVAEGLNFGVKDDLFHLKSEGFLGYTMDVEKIDANNLLSVSIPKLGITLLFRPPTTDVTLDNLRLPMVPGAVFLMSHLTWPHVVIDEAYFDISSWPQGPSIEEMAQHYSMSKPHFVHYLMLNNSRSLPMYNDEVCMETSRIFNEECKDESVRKHLMNVCTPFYTNKQFLELLTSDNIIGKYNEMQKKLFQRCEISICRRSIEECETMKTEMKKEFGDRLPEYFRDLNCQAATALQPRSQADTAQQPRSQAATAEKTMSATIVEVPEKYRAY